MTYQNVDMNSDSPYMLIVGNVKAEKCTDMTDEQNNCLVEKLNVASQLYLR